MLHIEHRLTKALQWNKELEKENNKLKKAFKLDKGSWFYKNCKRQRRAEAKICQCCPFRDFIEEQENNVKNSLFYL